MQTRETRTLKGLPAPEVRASKDGEGVVLAAYGAVFMRYSQNLGGFVEQVAPGAFAGTIARAAEGHNIAGLGNHEPSWLLGTTASGSLRMAEDSTGLGYEIDLDLEDPDGVRAKRKAETGKFRGSSFSFRTLPDGDEWAVTEEGFPLRTLVAVELYDVGPVTFPAYRSTEESDVAVALRSLAQVVDRDVHELVEAAGRNELRSLIPGSTLPPAEEAPKRLAAHRRKYRRAN